MNRVPQRILRTGFRHWLDTGQQTLVPEGAPPVELRSPSSICRPAPGSRPEDAGSLLLAAKALVFCGFPLQPTPLTSLTRQAQLGADTHLTVYFSTTEPGVPIPYGADRALLAWITTLTYDTGFVTFTNLTDFFEAFQLARSGVQYQRFEQRLQRLLSLSLSVILRTPTGVVGSTCAPSKRHTLPETAAKPAGFSPPRAARSSSRSCPPTLSATGSSSIPPSTCRGARPSIVRRRAGRRRRAFT
jgi:hypothetical protein